jgi:hypothetical protein
MQSASISRPGGRKVFGFPLQGFGLFSCLLLSFASALMTFCLATMVAIFSLLVWNLGGHHSVDFADTYLYVGLPASLIVLAIALPYFLTLWLRSKLHR